MAGPGRGGRGRRERAGPAVSGAARVCPFCRRPDPECDCPAGDVNEYRPPAAEDVDEDDDGYGW